MTIDSPSDVTVGDVKNEPSPSTAVLLAIEIAGIPVETSEVIGIWLVNESGLADRVTV